MESWSGEVTRLTRAVSVLDVSGWASNVYSIGRLTCITAQGTQGEGHPG